jgi:hypothetical protein
VAYHLPHPTLHHSLTQQPPAASFGLGGHTQTKARSGQLQPPRQPPLGACLGCPKPVLGLRNCLRHRYARPQKPVLAWVVLAVLSKGGQDWTGYPPPPAIHACGGRPQGGEGPLRPAYKPQRFREQKPSRLQVGAGWPGLVLLFVLCLFLIVKKGYQGEGSRLGGDSASFPTRRDASNSCG